MGQAFFVGRFAKFKADAVGGIYKHNERKLSDAAIDNSDSDIDVTRSHFNYDLLANKHGRGYKKSIDDVIENHADNAQVRKTSVVMCEALISASPSFFNDMDEDEIRDYFQTSLDWLMSELGEQNMLYAKVHLDEKTPHMHVGFVPITNDGRLSARDVINRKQCNRLQSELPRYLQGKGFDVERGEEGSKAKHLSKAQYARKKEIERQEMDVNQSRDFLQMDIEKFGKDADFVLKMQAERERELKEKEKELLAIQAENDALYEKKKAMLDESIKHANEQLALTKEDIKTEGETVAYMRAFDALKINPDTVAYLKDILRKQGKTTQVDNAEHRLQKMKERKMQELKQRNAYKGLQR